MTRLTSLDAYCCSPDTSIRDALARLNATEYVFQLIVQPGQQSGRFRTEFGWNIVYNPVSDWRA